MAFIAADSGTVMASFSQSSVHKIAISDGAEVVLRSLPEQTFSGTITRIVAVSGHSHECLAGLSDCAPL